MPAIFVFDCSCPLADDDAGRCAIASSARLDVLVCRYAPAGNIDGRRVP